MVTAAMAMGTGLVGTTAYPYSITVGWTEVAPANAELESIEFEENGDEDPGYARMRIWDRDNSISVVSQMVVRVHDNTLGTQVFLGTVLNRNTDAAAVGRYINVEGVSVSNMLDQLLVPLESRPAESDQARVLYLWGKYAKYPLEPSTSATVAETNAATSADLLSGMTLRAALDQTASLAGSNTRWFVNSKGQLVWRSGAGASSAPFNINVALAPGGGNIAPDDLDVERDGTIVNRLYVRGANAAGSGWFTDAASLATYGPRENYIDAASADTAAKAQTIAQLQLGKTAEPNIRAKFTTTDPNSGWRADQNVTVTSAQHDLSAEVLRIVKVTTRFWRGDGKRHFTIEAGKTGARLSGIPTAAAFISPSVGQPAFQLRGRLQVIDESGDLVGTLTSNDIQDQLILVGAKRTTSDGDEDGELLGASLRLLPDGSAKIDSPNPTGAVTSQARFTLAIPLTFQQRIWAPTVVGDELEPKTGEVTGTSVYEVAPSSNLTFTSTPTILAPADTSSDSQLLILIGTSSFTATFQDEATLGGSGLRLGATTRGVGNRDVLMLMYSPGQGAWVELNYSNNL